MTPGQERTAWMFWAVQIALGVGGHPVAFIVAAVEAAVVCAVLVSQWGRRKVTRWLAK